MCFDSSFILCIRKKKHEIKLNFKEKYLKLQ